MRIMKKMYKKTAAFLLAATLFLLPAGFISFADTGDLTYTNDSTNLRAVVRDSENLFSSEEEQEILNAAKDITAYANVLILTDSTNAYESNIRNAVISEFGTTEDSTSFYIDMGDRKIYIYSTNGAYQKITDGKANTITDNTYTYASRGDYATCATVALSQMETVLHDGSIPEPMKWIGCFMLSLAFSSLVVFFIIQRVVSQTDRIELQPIYRKAGASGGRGLVYRTIRTERHYSPQSDGGGSSGGGGGGFSGGGDGGGGFSGGGGGHSF